MRIADFVPPIVLKLRDRSHQPSTAYRTYEEALGACGNAGYESDQIARVVATKTRRLADGSLDPQRREEKGARVHERRLFQ